MNCIIYTFFFFFSTQLCFSWPSSNFSKHGYDENDVKICILSLLSVIVLLRTIIVQSLQRIKKRIKKNGQVRL